MEMKYPVKKEEEDQKGVFIDLDTRGNSPEDFVIEWHLEIRRFFGSNSVAVGESNLVNVMKRYIRDVSQRAVHFEDIERLQTMVDKHMEHIYWLYQDSDICFSDLYLFYMEEIMTFYVNLTLRVLLALKRKTKVTQKMVHDMTQKVVKRLSSYLLKSEYHIFHVLIRQTTTLVDEMIKDVLNILNSNICKQMFKNLYMHFLVQTPIADMSDEAFCRVYILFENWKAFDDYKQNEKFEECMRKLFNRGMDYVKSNAFLKKILQPQPSIMHDLMKVVGCDQSITKAYFDYIKSKQKAEAEILDDIGRLALEDAYISDSDSEEDESDAQYKEFYNQIMCDSNIENGELKSDKGFFSENWSQNDEIIVCDSDTDSDVEFVSIIPSRSNVNTPSPSGTPMRKKNPPNERPKVTSFLESISVDIELYRGNQGSRTKKSNSQPKIQEDLESSQVQNADTLCPLQTSKSDDPNVISDSSVQMECVNVDDVEVSLASENSMAKDVVDINDIITSGDNDMCGPSEQSSVVCDKPSGLSQLENSNDVIVSKNPEITDVSDRATVSFESQSNTAEGVCQTTEIAANNEKIPSATESTIETTEDNVQLSEKTNEVSIEGCSAKSPQISTPHPSGIVEIINEENLQTSNRTDTNSLTNESDSEVNHDKTRTATETQSSQNKDESMDFGQEKLLATNSKTSENLCETNLIESSPILVDRNCASNLEKQLQSSDNFELATISMTKEIGLHQKIHTTVNNELRKSTEEIVEGVSITPNNIEKLNTPQDNLFGKELPTVRDLTSQLEENLNLEGNTLDHLEDTLADMNLTSDYQLEQSPNIPSNDKQLEILLSEDKISNDDEKCSTNNSLLKTTEISSNCEQLVSENLNSCEKCGRYSKVINVYHNKELASTKPDKNYEKRMNSKNTLQLNKASESSIIDTGQSTFSKLLDTGQVGISNSQSSHNTNTQCAGILEVHNDEEQLTARTNSDQKVRENARVGHCEFGYPTPPGSEEDGDKDVDEQPDPIYTNILPSQTFNLSNSAYNGDRFAPETNSASNAPQVTFNITVSESTLTTLSESTLSQTYPGIFREDESVDRLSVVPQTVSELVNSERTFVNDDYLSEDVEVDDRAISSADTELLERLSDEEKEERNYINPDLGKSYEQIVKDAVGSQNSTEDEEEFEESTIVPQKGNIHPYRETPPQTPLSGTNCPVSESVDSLDDMEQFLKKYGNEEFSSLPRSSKRRKRPKENLSSETDVKVSKNLSPRSTKRVKINNKPETQIIPSSPPGDGGDDIFKNSNASSANDDEYASSADEKATNSESVQKRKHKSTAEPKPSPVPLSEYRTKKNGINTRIPQSGISSPKQPPLKGILKRVEQKHSYYPLHPLEDESDTVVIVLQQSEGRGKRGSIEVKINRKSFTAYKVPFNDPKLCQRIIVNVERLSANTLLVWERVTSRSRGNFVEDMPLFQPDKPMYKIVFDKNTTQLSSNDRKYYCEPSISDESSALHKLKNSNLVPGNDTGDKYLSKNAHLRTVTESSLDEDLSSSNKRKRKITIVDKKASKAKKIKASDANPDAEEPSTSCTLVETLTQYAGYYRQQEEEAYLEGHNSQASRMERIVKRFEQSIKQLKAGKSVAIDKLPVPPGFPPPFQSKDDTPQGPESGIETTKHDRPPCDKVSSSMPAKSAGRKKTNQRKEVDSNGQNSKRKNKLHDSG